MCDKHFTIEKNKQTYCLSCKKILIESKHLAFCNKCNNYTKYIYSEKPDDGSGNVFYTCEICNSKNKNPQCKKFEKLI